MSRMLLPLSITAALMGGAAYADVPRVAVDIPPVHSLVARVMEGMGTPALIVQPGATPHEYSLRPSEAAGLQEAEIVFWVGPDLTPWLEEAIETLTTDASVTELLEADGTIALAFREGALFEAHDHGDRAHDEHTDGEHQDHAHDEKQLEHKDHDAHGKGSHEDHAAEATGHNEHDHDNHDDHVDHGDHAGHDHGAHDPHAWLSPQNAATWLNVIAGQLSAADPQNAGVYFANAAAGRAEIDALSVEVNVTLEPVRGMRFIVFHDAYQYFENAFGFPAAGAISVSDASDPSPARIAEIRARIADEGIDCVLAEPQFNPGLVATVLEGTEAGTAVLDPLGSDLESGPALYPQLIRNLASTLTDCL